MIDLKHIPAIADSINAVLQSRRKFLDATHRGQGTRSSDKRFFAYECRLAELRRLLADAGYFKRPQHQAHYNTESEMLADAALQTIARELGEAPMAPLASDPVQLLSEESAALLTKVKEDVGDYLVEGKASARTGKRLTKEESESLVRDYLKDHKARTSKGEVSIREVSQETGVPQSSVANTAAWKACQSRLVKEGKSKQPLRRKAQAYTSAMDHVTGATDAELQRLIDQQATDYEPSPLDERTHKDGKPTRVKHKKKA